MCVRLVVLNLQKMLDTFFAENCDGYHLSGLPVERKTAQSPTVMVSSSLLIFWWYSFRACMSEMRVNNQCRSNFI